MTDMGGVLELEISSPLAVRIHRNELPGRLEFYFAPSASALGARSSMLYTSLDKITRFVLGESPSTHTTVHGCTPSIGHKIRSDMGAILLFSVHFIIAMPMA